MACLALDLIGLTTHTMNTFNSMTAALDHVQFQLEVHGCYLILTKYESFLIEYELDIDHYCDCILSTAVFRDILKF